MNHDIYDITNNRDSYIPVRFQSTILKAAHSEHLHWLQVYIFKKYKPSFYHA